MRDEDRVARESEEAADDRRDGRRPAQIVVAQARQGRDARLQARPRVGERAEALLELERAHAHRADLTRPRGAGPQAGRLEVEDDERRLLEQQFLARRRGERDEIAGPAQARICRDRLCEQRACEPNGNGRTELQHLPRRLVRRHRPAALLDELDEPVGGIETQLHSARC